MMYKSNQVWKALLYFQVMLDSVIWASRGLSHILGFGVFPPSTENAVEAEDAYLALCRIGPLVLKGKSNLSLS